MISLAFVHLTLLIVIRPFFAATYRQRNGGQNAAVRLRNRECLVADNQHYNRSLGPAGDIAPGYWQSAEEEVKRAEACGVSSLTRLQVAVLFVFVVVS